METILVAGVESVVGANLAVSLSDRYHLVGLSLKAATPVSLPGCETALCADETEDAVRQWVASVRPQRIVYCGAAARSAWQSSGPSLSEPQLVAAAERWARAAEEFDCRLTMISSDAVFTGPWMFHTETSDCFCDSMPARAIRAAEARIAELAPSALVVRTHAYGWAPAAAGPGWIEKTLSDLEGGTAGPFDSLRYGTPILATDLVEVLVRAWHEELAGLYHLAGAERANPSRFVERLADEFDLSAPLQTRTASLSERPTGFGCGETSLHTKKIRKALCVAMPTLAEGLGRLREQWDNGYCERLQPHRGPIRDKVA